MRLELGRNPRRWAALLVFVVMQFAYPTAVFARDVYVAPGGSDSNPGTAAQPYQTIRKALESVGAGDTVYLRAGVYDQSVNSRTQTLPNGNSFEEAVTIRAYPGEEVILQPRGLETNVITLTDGAQYTVWQDLILDGSASASGFGTSGISIGNGANHHRFVNVEIRNMNSSGIFVGPQAGTTHNEFIEVNVHHGALTGTGHGIYVSNSDNLIDGGEFHHFQGDAGRSRGIQLYDGGVLGTHRNTVRNVRVYANTHGMDVGSGQGNMIYNNLIYDNSESGVSIGYGASGTKFYNNTVVGTTHDHAVTVLPESTSTEVINNIFWKNVVNGVNDLARDLVSESNLTVDPFFADEERSDFRLRSRSPAIDRGRDLSSNGITRDIDGFSRPIGKGFDIGAHEFVGRTP